MLGCPAPVLSRRDGWRTCMAPGALLRAVCLSAALPFLRPPTDRLSGSTPADAVAAVERPLRCADAAGVSVGD